MNTHITDNDRVAMCKACTIAEAMKTCKLCAFQIGLENNTMIKNQVVKVYQKPLTGEELEGMARLIVEIREDTGDGLSIWLVEFTDELGEKYQRTINKNNA